MKLIEFRIRDKFPVTLHREEFFGLSISVDNFIYRQFRYVDNQFLRLGIPLPRVHINEVLNSLKKR